jgi:hypothetical protein
MAGICLKCCKWTDKGAEQVEHQPAAGRGGVDRAGD